MQKIEVKSNKMKSWEAFSLWNYVLHFFLNFLTDFFYFWYGTPNRYWDYLCEISSSYFGWFGRYLAWGGTLSGLVLRWPWSALLSSFQGINVLHTIDTFHVWNSLELSFGEYMSVKIEPFQCQKPSAFRPRVARFYEE